MAQTINVSPEKMREYKVIVKLNKPYNNGINYRVDMVRLLKENNGVNITLTKLRDAHKYTNTVLRQGSKPKKEVSENQKTDYELSKLSWLLLQSQWNRSFNYATA